MREDALVSLGYFLKPSELFSEIAKKGNSISDDEKAETQSNFILGDLAKILRNIEQSTMGMDSEEDFDHLFEDLDLNSTKLGKTEKAKNELISKVLSHLDKIYFKLSDTKADVLGDAYEYLIGQFASYKEQLRIASFLESIDDKIHFLTKKKMSLEGYKNL